MWTSCDGSEELEGAELVAVVKWICLVLSKQQVMISLSGNADR